ncbi:2'-5'-oligoadenylate synthase 3-like [Haliotis rubra]|uniref:2'-5'-oligoadenylate synthase 3-like n=1 Tax=Haliotis rubra TaxID=36100 RepID=UPI001EE52B60|nr:2'-5'-oligoadenylate synthase 3-like [Haliotis rubra]XP_046545406.1 2'-5'-oligoadenylate synthase 3-like [Haliotis rubra]
MSLTCRVCSRTFHNDLAIFNHVRHKCKTCFCCNYTFSGFKQIRSHMREKHLNYECTICKRAFFLATSCEDHTRMRHRNRKSFDSELQRCGDFSGLVNDIQPNQEKMERCREAVEKLKLFMQHNTKYSIEEFVKGGSFKKGTSVKDTFDLDLVVFINDYTSVAQWKKNMTEILSTLKHHIVQGDITWAKGISFKKKTHRSLQFSITGHKGEKLLEVDLLPAVDLGKGPREDIFKEMKKSPKTRHLYSACLTKDQIGFVESIPLQVKNLIRLVKYWKEIEAVKIRSYCVELIVIGLWIQWGDSKTFDMREGFRRVMEKLSCLRSLQMDSLGKHRASDYTTLPAPPAVIDPANPFVNVADNIKPGDFDYIERKANAALANAS